MTNEIRRRFEYNTYLARHLTELNQLVGRKVNASDLISLEETDRMYQRTKHIAREPTQKFVIPFLERNGARMNSLIQNAYRMYSGAVYLWTEYTNVCGGFVLASLLEFNLNFDFEIDNNGVFSLHSDDLHQKLLLDFSEENGQRVLEIELSGDQWGTIVF